MQAGKLLWLAFLIGAVPTAEAAVSLGGSGIRADTTRKPAHIEGAEWHPIRVERSTLMRLVPGDSVLLPSTDGKPERARSVRSFRSTSGDWTWVGRVRTRLGDESVVLTFGDHAVFGTIPQPSGVPLRLATLRGRAWLVEGTSTPIPLLAPQSDALVRPPPVQSRAWKLIASPATTQAATSATPLVDVLTVYTPSMVSFYGSVSAVNTRIAYLESLANQAYLDSGANLRLRVVATKLLDDPIPDNWGLIQLITDPSTDPVKVKIDAWRRQYGADLVSVIRAIEPIASNESLGWINGYHGAPFDPINGFSVIGDEGAGVAGADYHFAHETGHNLGCHHDDAATSGDYGAYVFSRGYRQLVSTSAGFGTIMAYAQAPEIRLGLFSNPRIANCMGKPCGIVDFADNARSLTMAAPAVGAMIASAARSSDFDADARSDVLWRHARTGANSLWRSADAGAAQALTAVKDLNWQIAGKGDFDGDGHADILWRNASTGGNVIWRSGQSAQSQAITGVSNLAWKVAGIGDFDHDGRADILWRNGNTGANVIWRAASASSQQAVTGVADLNWTVAGIGDFDGDGAADIFWRNTATGANVIWKSARSTIQQAAAKVADLRWRIAAVGDFNGDGRSDLFWRHDGTGADVLWLSANAAASRSLTPVSNLAWQPAASGDFDGDGHSDVFWRNSATGANVVWRSADSTTQFVVPAVADLAWKVVPN